MENMHEDLEVQIGKLQYQQELLQRDIKAINEYIKESRTDIYFLNKTLKELRESKESLAGSVAFDIGALHAAHNRILSEIKDVREGKTTMVSVSPDLTDPTLVPWGEWSYEKKVEYYKTFYMQLPEKMAEVFCEYIDKYPFKIEIARVKPRAIRYAIRNGFEWDRTGYSRDFYESLIGLL